MSDDRSMARIDAERWIAAVTTNGSLSGAAAKEIDNIIVALENKLRALSAEQPAKEAVAEVTDVWHGGDRHQVKWNAHAIDALPLGTKLYAIPSADPRPSERRVRQQSVWEVSQYSDGPRKSSFDRRKPTERKDSDGQV